jgi:hypothetical protein
MEKMKYEVARYGQYVIQKILESVVIEEGRKRETEEAQDVDYIPLLLIAYYEKHIGKLVLARKKTIFSFAPAEALALLDVIVELPSLNPDIDTELYLLREQLQKYLDAAPWRVIHEQLELKHGTQ